MNIAVIFGGISTERDISIKSGIAVYNALKQLGYNAILVDPALGKDGFIHSVEEAEKLPKYAELDAQIHNKQKYLECISSSNLNEINLAFIVLHGKYGEDGTIQTLLDFKDIPYTGSKPKAHSIGLDKNLSKLLFSSVRIPTPRWTVVRKEDAENFELAEELRDEFGKKMVIKPNDQGSTIGVTIVTDGNLDEIHNGVKLASSFSDLVIVEEYIEGREITVGIIGNEALPVIEIVPQSGFYDFEHKYTRGKTEYICPAEIPDDVASFTQELALMAYNIIGAEGFARVDFRLNEDNQPFILEVNTIPGFTETSLVPKAAKAIGIEFPELCQKIINEALKKED
jgi:D-alanine-D-alanine ligase